MVVPPRTIRAVVNHPRASRCGHRWSPVVRGGVRGAARHRLVWTSTIGGHGGITRQSSSRPAGDRSGSRALDGGRDARLGQPGGAPPGAAARHPARPDQARGRRPPARDRAHRDLHAGEPLLRQLPRACSAGATASRSAARRAHQHQPRRQGRPRRSSSATRDVRRARRRQPVVERQPHVVERRRAWTASSRRRRRHRDRWGTTTAPTCPSTTGSPAPSRSATAGSARCSAQTFPNRRYLQAATSVGIVSTDVNEVLATPDAPNGVIWDRLNDHGITWNDYAIDLADILLFPNFYGANTVPREDVPPLPPDCAQRHAAAGEHHQPRRQAPTPRSRPADIQIGEAYSASIINARAAEPARGRRR